MTTWKTPGLTPDEQTYVGNAEQFRARGLSSIRYACESFALGHMRADLPPPTRWLWTVLVRWFGFAPWWVALVAPSPLSMWAFSRKLQDGPVALLTCVAAFFGFSGHPIAAALTCVVLLCIKEGGLLMLPAVFVAMLTGGHVSDVWVLPLAVPVWAALSLAVCGWSWLPALIRSVRNQTHDYTRAFQQGAPHRLVVDLALVSPWVLLLAPLADWRVTAIAATIVAAHMLSPVRNVRTILAADLMLRVAVGAWLASHGWWGLGACVSLVAWDVWLTRRMRGLRDTVTHALGQAMGIVP